MVNSSINPQLRDQVGRHEHGPAFRVGILVGADERLDELAPDGIEARRRLVEDEQLRPPAVKCART
jgi:hypothetical protein